MVPFAGWDMPVWYTSVIEEHLAVRHAAGLFDVSHMGVYQAEGDGAAAFLDSVVGNDVAKLEVGQSHYTQFLRPDGQVIDDLMIYRRGPQTYLIVVNAANDDKDWAWLQAVKSGEVRIDEQRPWSLAFGRGCRLRNLRDPEAGADMRVDIALQGPNSRDILLALGTDEASAAKLKGLKWAGLMEGRFGDFDLVVSRTGYTGRARRLRAVRAPRPEPGAVGRAVEGRRADGTEAGRAGCARLAPHGGRPAALRP